MYRLKRGYKFLFVYVVWLLIYFNKQKFACQYAFIKREEIIDELVQKVNYATDADVQPCSYDFVNNTNFDDVHDYVKPEVKYMESGQHIPECKAAYSIAIIIPYRNRKSQLDIFIPYIHSFLQKQNVHYRIFVVEQLGNDPWNKGKLFNAGAKIAIGLNFPCLILHDVDLLPLNLANVYACTSMPRHMSANIDKFRYNLPYVELVGGAVAMLTSQYIDINGFSNKFEYWGGEDDDLYNRIMNENLNILRFPPDISRYKMMMHKQEVKNANRYLDMEESNSNYQNDGLNSLTYKRMNINEEKLYTNITLII